jgi:hypothetical protein
MFSLRELSKSLDNSLCYDDLGYRNKFQEKPTLRLLSRRSSYWSPFTGHRF